MPEDSKSIPPKPITRPGRYGRIYTDILTEEKLHNLMSGKRGHYALAMWSLGLALVNKELSDGVVQPHQLRAIYGTRTDAKNLVRVGLWDEHPEGWYYHNYVEEGCGLTRDGVERLKIMGAISNCKREMKKKRPCVCGFHDELGNPIGDLVGDL